MITSNKKLNIEALQCVGCGSKDIMVIKRKQQRELYTFIKTNPMMEVLKCKNCGAMEERCLADRRRKQ